MEHTTNATNLPPEAVTVLLDDNDLSALGAIFDHIEGIIPEDFSWEDAASLALTFALQHTAMVIGKRQAAQEAAQ